MSCVGAPRREIFFDLLCCSQLTFRLQSRTARSQLKVSLLVKSYPQRAWMSCLSLSHLSITFLGLCLLPRPAPLNANLCSPCSTLMLSCIYAPDKYASHSLASNIQDLVSYTYALNGWPSKRSGSKKSWASERIDGRVPFVSGATPNRDRREWQAMRILAPSPFHPAVNTPSTSAHVCAHSSAAHVHTHTQHFNTTCRRRTSWLTHLVAPGARRSGSRRAAVELSGPGT